MCTQKILYYAFEVVYFNLKQLGKTKKFFSSCFLFGLPFRYHINKTFIQTFKLSPLKMPNLINCYPVWPSKSDNWHIHS